MGRDPRQLQSASAWGSVARRLPPCDRAWPDRREGAAHFLRIAACNNKYSDDDHCRAQGSFRGRSYRLMMGCVRKMPQGLPTWYVTNLIHWGPRRSLRGQSARRPGRDAFRLRGSSMVANQAAAFSADCHSNSVPLRQIECRITASLRATAIEARFQPIRLASRCAQSFSGQDFRTRVISTPAAS